MDKLLQRCAKRAHPTKVIWRCRGDQCGYTFAGRAKGRVTHHAKDCPKLRSDLQQEAAKFKRTKAPSVVVQEADAKAEKRRKKNEGLEPRPEKGQTASFQIPPSSEGFFTEAKAQGRTQKHARVSLSLTKLFCSAGLPMRVVSQDDFIDMLKGLDTSFKVPSRESLETDLIPGEQEVVKEIQMKSLRGSWYLTISYDGGTNRGREAFWTFHISIAGQSKVYMVEAKEATGDSHTAEWIKSTAVSVSSCCFSF